MTLTPDKAPRFLARPLSLRNDRWAPPDKTRRFVTTRSYLANRRNLQDVKVRSTSGYFGPMDRGCELLTKTVEMQRTCPQTPQSFKLVRSSLPLTTTQHSGKEFTPPLPILRNNGNFGVREGGCELFSPKSTRGEVYLLG
jgi:hypothetical protein